MTEMASQLGYWLLKAKFKLLAYAFASLLAVRLILKTTLSPAAKPQVDGSAVLVAMAFCQVVLIPVDAGTSAPQAVRPVPLFLYTW